MCTGTPWVVNLGYCTMFVLLACLSVRKLSSILKRWVTALFITKIDFYRLIPLLPAHFLLVLLTGIQYRMLRFHLPSPPYLCVYFQSRWRGSVIPIPYRHKILTQSLYLLYSPPRSCILIQNSFCQGMQVWFTQFFP